VNTRKTVAVAAAVSTAAMLGLVLPTMPASAEPLPAAYSGSTHSDIGAIHEL